MKLTAYYRSASSKRHSTSTGSPISSWWRRRMASWGSASTSLTSIKLVRRTTFLSQDRLTGRGNDMPWTSQLHGCILQVQSDQDARIRWRQNCFYYWLRNLLLQGDTLRVSKRGATFQRMVDKVFKDLIRSTMEVCIDDMLVKSVMHTDHLQHLDEGFSLLWKYKVNLNPEKCTLGVASGKFLGYLVTQWGIEADPDQIFSILNMKSPHVWKRSRCWTDPSQLWTDSSADPRTNASPSSKHWRRTKLISARTKNAR